MSEVIIKIEVICMRIIDVHYMTELEIETMYTYERPLAERVGEHIND